jgi:hypothetical protein
LTCHPSTPCAAIRRFAVQVWREDGKLALTYRLEGDIAALDIPPTSPPHRADGLWQTTCFEVFITVLPQTDLGLKTESALEGGYYEFNFSPSTAWASYHFTAYRQGMVLVDLVEPVKIAVLRDADWLELTATINLDGLPLAEEGGLLLGLSAVIKEKHGGVSYWAFAHTKVKPDFHHPDSFAFGLDPDD